jgi:hypothetical protein
MKHETESAPMLWKALKTAAAVIAVLTFFGVKGLKTESSARLDKVEPRLESVQTDVQWMKKAIVRIAAKLNVEIEPPEK